MQYLMNGRLGMTLNGAIDASVRFILGVVLCLFELFSHLALRNAPQDESFYVRAILVAGLLFVLFLRFGQSNLVCDLREICLYDVLVQVFGLCWFALGNRGYVTQTLAGTVLVLKLIRLCWPGQGRWPVFGMLGWWQRRRWQRAPVDAGQNRLTYLVLLMTPVLGYLVAELDKLGMLAGLAAVPVLYLVVYAGHFFSSLSQAGARLSSLSRERDQAMAEVLELKRQLAAGGEISQEQQALLQAYNRIDPKLRSNLVPMLEQFAERFPLQAAGAESGRVGSGPG